MVNQKMYEEFKTVKEMSNWNDFIFENDKYAIIIPKDINSIIEEGNELKHAVGTDYYLSKILKEELIILFCRKKRNLSESFFTIAIKDNKVIMIKGLSNKEINQYENKDSLESFINEWKKEKELV